MAEKELQVIVKAKELALHTMKLTSNCNRYPKKYRHSLVDKMQNKCLDIYTSSEVYAVMCCECGARSGRASTKQEAKESWNERNN